VILRTSGYQFAAIGLCQGWFARFFTPEDCELTKPSVQYKRVAIY
jgi:hypothetical protein